MEHELLAAADHFIKTTLDSFEEGLIERNQLDQEKTDIKAIMRLGQETHDKYISNWEMDNHDWQELLIYRRTRLDNAMYVLLRVAKLVAEEGDPIVRLNLAEDLVGARLKSEHALQAYDEAI